jgi:hypothetical protein
MITRLTTLNGADPILNLAPNRYVAIINVLGVLVNNPTPAQPAVPATTVAQQNVNPYPVTVVITGGTMTVVAVNGTQVGTGAGTYLVPAGGTITLTYSVAPTGYVWSNASPGGNSNVILTTTAGEGQNAGLEGAGTVLQPGMSVRHYGQDDMFVSAIGAGTPPYVSVIQVFEHAD